MKTSRSSDEKHSPGSLLLSLQLFQEGVGPLDFPLIDRCLCAISGPPTRRAKATIHLPTPSHQAFTPNRAICTWFAPGLSSCPFLSARHTSHPPHRYHLFQEASLDSPNLTLFLLPLNLQNTSLRKIFFLLSLLAGGVP